MFSTVSAAMTTSAKLSAREGSCMAETNKYTNSLISAADKLIYREGIVHFVKEADIFTSVSTDEVSQWHPIIVTVL